ncbi:MAG: DUF1573 domain-containing protein, partial [Prolixibacteraceae bacterium]
MRIKQFIGYFGAILVLFSACNQPTKNNSQSTAITDTGKKSPGKIEFNKEIHNFGTLSEGETVVYSFQFKNNGSSPFRLTKVEPTCGCLSVQFSKDEIGSQASSVIDVIFHTDGEWGNQIKTVSVETSGGETKTLTIGAYVENKNFNIDLNNLK